MSLIRVRGKAGAVGGGKSSARVGLAGGSRDEGTLGECQGERCISLEGA